MIDIYYLLCPLTNEIRCLSRARYPKVEPILAKNPDYREWIKFLKKRRLKPIIKILDRVPFKDLSKVYDSYLEKFQEQGIQLFNVTPLRKFNVFEHLMSTEHNGSFLLEDIGYIHEKLASIFYDQLSYVRYHSDSKLVTELIYFIGGIITYEVDFKPFLLMDISKLKEIHQDTSLKKSIPRYINSSFHDATHNKKGHDKLFPTISKFEIGYMLNGINHLFAYYQIQIIMSHEVLKNLSNIYIYLTNTKELNYWHDVVDDVNTILKNRKSKIRPKAFNQMAEDVQTMIEHNLDFAYSKTNTSTLLKKIQGLN